MKLNCKNQIKITGEVKNFKLGETKNGKKLAYIGIRNTETNNHIQVTLYDRKGLTYGTGDNKQEVTLSSLAKIFLDSDNKPKGIKISAIGTTSEFTGERGTFENNNVFSLYPASEDKQQSATFVLEGVVESVAHLEDKDDNEYLKVTVGTLSYKGKEQDLEIRGCSVKTIYVRDEELVEKLDDLSKGDYVSLKGYITNIMPKYDEFGDKIEDGCKEYTAVRAAILCEADELDEQDVANYNKAKTLKVGESIKVYKDNEDDEDELD